MNHKIPKRVRLALTRILGDPNLPPDTVMVVSNILVTGVLPDLCHITRKMRYSLHPIDSGLEGAAKLKILLILFDTRRRWAKPWASKLVQSSLVRLEDHLDAKYL